MTPPGHGGSPLSRRKFLLGAAAVGAAGLGGWYAVHRGWLPWPDALRFRKRPFGGRPEEVARPDLAMPGRYPGRVVEVRHPASVSNDNVIDPAVVAAMIDRGMAELTGADPGDVRGAWGTFFEKGDVVGVKVNPVGRAPKPGEGRTPNAVGAISSPAVVVKVVRSLRELGIPAKDIVLFERYADEFDEAGYLDLVERELPGVRWMASAVRYTDSQLDITGFDQGRDSTTPEKARHVVGYDPDVFVTMGFCMPHKNGNGEVIHDPRDDRRYRSHLSRVVSRLVNKMVTIPVLKDHRSAGVTLALKNLSHGMNNNVCRSHLSDIKHGQLYGGAELVTGPNQCNTFIPQAVSQRRLREKATLHILDGLIGVYEGGPGCWNRTWGTWRHRGLLFATDPVALDHVGWDLIDAKRAEMGWPAVGDMGQVNTTDTLRARTGLTTLAAAGPLEAAALAFAADNLERGRQSEVFNLRTPDHITLAGQLGLGKFERKDISFRRVPLDA
jgi:hypothetical protein